MNQTLLTQALSARIADLYHRMEESYTRVAEVLGFSCAGCDNNCCDSYFQHHTYIEWAYLWEGLHALEHAYRQTLEEKARDCLAETEKMLARGEVPQVMCPLNVAGLCSLYNHRLMICRMHGVPSVFTLPTGVKKDFPGCGRCQELVKAYQGEAPVVDRTGLYQELAQLEKDFRGQARQPLPRVKLTLAQMMVMGPPNF